MHAHLMAVLVLNTCSSTAESESSLGSESESQLQIIKRKSTRPQDPRTPNHQPETPTTITLAHCPGG